MIKDRNQGDDKFVSHKRKSTEEVLTNPDRDRQFRGHGEIDAAEMVEVVAEVHVRNIGPIIEEIRTPTRVWGRRAMTKFGTRTLDRKAALNVATRNVGRLINLTDCGRALIGFTKRELGRGDVGNLIHGQQIQEQCTCGKPFWFQARTWFEIGDEIGETEWQEFTRAAREESRRTDQPVD